MDTEINFEITQAVTDRHESSISMYLIQPPLTKSSTDSLHHSRLIPQNHFLCVYLLPLLGIPKLPTPLRSLNFLSQKLNHTPRILGRKRRASGYDDVTPGISGTLDCIWPNPAIHFDV
jgi:hypothetical protein